MGLLLLGTCDRFESAPSTFEHARQAFIHGHLEVSQREAERGYRRFSRASPDWAWKFKILQAEALYWRQQYPQVLALLESSSPAPVPVEAAISVLTLRGLAHGRTLELQKAIAELDEAKQMCAQLTMSSCGEALQAYGVVALTQNHFADAMQYFEQSLSFSRTTADRFLETTSLLNLSAVLIKESRFDEAIDRANASLAAAKALEAEDVIYAIQQNLAWASYRLGESERAMEILQEAERHAVTLDDVYLQENALTDVGYIQMDSHLLDAAENSFQRALSLSRKGDNAEQQYNVLRALARLAVQKDNLENAEDYSHRASEIASKTHSPLDEIYPLFVQAQIAARRGDTAEAENKFHMIEQDPITPAFMKWQCQHSLALLYERRMSRDLADFQYRSALATLESTRETVRHDDFQLSFLANGAHIYDDYIHFLIANGRTEEALRWADHSRARALAEGLGLLPKGKPAAPAKLNVGSIAKRTDATILFYWLGEQSSYLWAINAKQTKLFTLPSSAEIEKEVERHNASLSGPQSLVDATNDRDFALYRMLIAPAANMVSSGKVIIIPDGKLNSLNFETLLVPEPNAHFWIDDVMVANANSLRLLTSPRSDHRPAGRNLLLLGSAISPSNEFPELRNAPVEIKNVGRHFPSAQQYRLLGEKATAAGYLNSNPEQYAYIHFVTHAVASRLSPLDSAIILSPNSDKSDSFKLYARDIIHHPVRANLVTISSCYSAGTRAYSGEGLVGLSWAFLFAGAHNVVAALWDASDLSTSELMDKFYEELNSGKDPDVALRAAKLSLLHSKSAFRKPFYWGPFQLYVGS